MGRQKVNPKDTINIISAVQLRSEVSSLRDAILQEETEHNWEKMDAALQRFTGAVRGGACSFEDDFVAAFRDKDFVRSFSRCLLTERTRLSASALDLLSATTRLGTAFQPLLHIYAPVLVKLLSRPNKIYVLRTQTCLTAILHNTRLPTLLPFLNEGLCDKAASVRQGCMTAIYEGLAGGPNQSLLFEKSALTERLLTAIEDTIRKAAVDKDPKIRETARSIWQIYMREWSHRVDGFSDPLTPIVRRYLNLATTQGQALKTSQNGPVSPTRAPVKTRPALPSKAPTFIKSTTSRPASPTKMRPPSPTKLHSKAAQLSSSKPKAGKSEIATNSQQETFTNQEQPISLPTPPIYISEIDQIYASLDLDAPIHPTTTNEPIPRTNKAASRVLVVTAPVYVQPIAVDDLSTSLTAPTIEVTRPARVTAAARLINRPTARRAPGRAIVISNATPVNVALPNAATQIVLTLDPPEEKAPLVEEIAEIRIVEKESVQAQATETPFVQCEEANLIDFDTSLDGKVSTEGTIAKLSSTNLQDMDTLVILAESGQNVAKMLDSVDSASSEESKTGETVNLPATENTDMNVDIADVRMPEEAIRMLPEVGTEYRESQSESEVAAADRSLDKAATQHTPMDASANTLFNIEAEDKNVDPLVSLDTSVQQQPLVSETQQLMVVESATGSVEAEEQPAISPIEVKSVPESSIAPPVGVFWPSIAPATASTQISVEAPVRVPGYARTTKSTRAASHTFVRFKPTKPNLPVTMNRSVSSGSSLSKVVPKVPSLIGIAALPVKASSSGPSAIPVSSPTKKAAQAKLGKFKSSLQAPVDRKTTSSISRRLITPAIMDSAKSKLAPASKGASKPAPRGANVMIKKGETEESTESLIQTVAMPQSTDSPSSIDSHIKTKPATSPSRLIATSTLDKHDAHPLNLKIKDEPVEDDFINIDVIALKSPKTSPNTVRTELSEPAPCRTRTNSQYPPYPPSVLDRSLRSGTLSAMAVLQQSPSTNLLSRDTPSPRSRCSSLPASASMFSLSQLLRPSSESRKSEESISMTDLSRRSATENGNIAFDLSFDSAQAKRISGRPKMERSPLSIKSNLANQQSVILRESMVAFSGKALARPKSAVYDNLAWPKSEAFVLEQSENIQQTLTPSRNRPPAFPRSRSDSPSKVGKLTPALIRF